MSEAAPAQTAKSVADRASRRTMSEHRRRVWLNVAVFSLVTAAMVVLSMAHRDHQSVRSCQRRLELRGRNFRSYWTTAAGWRRSPSPWKAGRR